MTTEQIIENTGVEGFFDKLTEVTGALTEELVNVAPSVAEALLTLVQVKGVFHISIGLLALFGVYKAFNMLKTVKFCESRNSLDLTESVNDAMKLVFGVLLILSFAFISLFNLQFYHWISAIYPEGALALKALSAAGIDL